MSDTTGIAEHCAILGTTGAGKTVTAKRRAEHLLELGRHVVILDPLGAWKGLRLRADGKTPGFDIPIFGGRDGDAPIQWDDGAAIAGFIVDTPTSAIVDLSQLTTGSQLRRFAAGFVRRLRAKPDGELHLFVDEADEFYPQTVADSYGHALVEDFRWIAKRGRMPGFVLTTITQRPAEIQKSVLNMIQTLIVHQLIGPLDVAAVEGWLKANADKGTLTNIKSTLPTLARGDRWVYSPKAKVLELGTTTMIQTFDSSRTTQAGDIPFKPKPLASIDLSSLRTSVPDKEDDGSTKDGASSAEIEALRSEVAQLTQRNAELVQEIAQRDEAARNVAEQLGGIAFVLSGKPLVIGSAPVVGRADAAVEPASSASTFDEARRKRDARGAKTVDKPGAYPDAKPGDTVPVVEAIFNAPKGRPYQVLEILADLTDARRGDGAVREKAWALAAGVSTKSSTWRGYKAALRPWFDDTGGGMVRLTVTAAALFDRPDNQVRPAPPTGTSIIRDWATGTRIGKGPRAVLAALLDAHPQPVAREKLAETVGVDDKSSTWRGYVAPLNTFGLIESDRSAYWLPAEIMEIG